MSIWARPELEYLQKRAGCHTETGRTKKSSAGNQTWRCNDPTGIHEEIMEMIHGNSGESSAVGVGRVPKLHVRILPPSSQDMGIANSILKHPRIKPFFTDAKYC